MVIFIVILSIVLLVVLVVLFLPLLAQNSFLFSIIAGAIVVGDAISEWCRKVIRMIIPAKEEKRDQ